MLLPAYGPSQPRRRVVRTAMREARAAGLSGQERRGLRKTVRQQWAAQQPASERFGARLNRRAPSAAPRGLPSYGSRLRTPKRGL